MKISVIIPHLNDLEGLTRCIAALDAQILPRSDFEVIVADNGSDCGIDVVRQHAPGALVVAVAERGAGPARNGGVAASSGEILAFTDSDCIPDRGWLAAGLAALVGCDIAGGDMVVTTVDERQMTGAEAFEVVFAFDNRTYVLRDGFSVTANLFTTRAVFDRTGGFPTGVSEDVAWCRAATGQGFRLGHADDARVSHPARRTYGELARKWRRLTAESYALWRSEGRSNADWCLRALVVLASPLGHAPLLLLSTRIPGFTARIPALLVLFRIRAARAFWMLQAASAERTIVHDAKTELQGVR
jgi:glycosyltransferase involved in cell wall biosynthesis